MSRIIALHSFKFVLFYFILSSLALILKVTLDFFPLGVSFNFFFSVGFLFGWLGFKYGNREFHKYKLNEKTKDLETSSCERKIGQSLRRIVFENGMANGNNSFLCDYLVRGKVVFQLLHRANFPELCKTYDDKEFGIVLYFRPEWVFEEKIGVLNKILQEESSKPIGNQDYYVLNFGNNIRLGIFIINRILQEVYLVQDAKEFEYELTNEGDLPY